MFIKQNNPYIIYYVIKLFKVGRFKTLEKVIVILISYAMLTYLQVKKPVQKALFSRWYIKNAVGMQLNYVSEFLLCLTWKSVSGGEGIECEENVKRMSRTYVMGVPRVHFKLSYSAWYAWPMHHEVQEIVDLFLDSHLSRDLSNMLMSE